MEKHIRLNITLPQSIANNLTTVSHEMNEKKSQIISKALELYFDQLDIIIAESRLDEIENNQASPVPAEEVWANLGL